MRSRRKCLALVSQLLIFAAILVLTSNAAAEPKIYTPQIARAVDSAGENCKVDTFADGDCKQEKKAKKKTAKKKRKKKTSSSADSTDSTSAQTQSNEPSGLDSGVPGSSTNWMRTNGLTSPICASSATSTVSALKQNCDLSGIASVPTPTGHLGLDIHIDTGWSKTGNFFANTMQNGIGIAWVLMVNITATIFAGLEWSFSLNLLDAATMGKIATQLQSIQSTWTSPMARLAMVFFAMWFMWIGIVRRQYRTAYGELGTSFAMTVAVLMIIANPIGTVGSINKFSNDLALTAINTIQAPADAMSTQRNAGDSSGYAKALGTVFDSVVVRSWALLEFGDVEWATSPKKLNPELKKAAQELVSDSPASVRGKVARAKTNAAIVMQFAPNTAERDGINDKDGKKTLLRVLCGNDDVNKCKGSTKAIADQRTASGTDARVGQMVLAGTGLVCIWVILGLICIGLLGAAVASVFYLVLAAVTLPMAWLHIGGANRKFQQFLIDLLGALFAKLVYALALAVVMLLFNIVVSLQLSFFKQWLLLMAAFWFMYKRRKELTAAIPAVMHPSRTGNRMANRARRRIRRLPSDLRPKRKLDRSPGEKKPKKERKPPGTPRPSPNGPSAPGPGVVPGWKPGREGKLPRIALAANVAESVVDTARRRALGKASQANADLSPMRERLGRLSLQEVDNRRKLEGLKKGTPEYTKALRRQKSLERRRDRMNNAVMSARRDIERGRDLASRPADRVAEQARANKLIDNQAIMPANNRDYRRLSAMAGMTPEAYDQLSGQERNGVRSSINRELAARRSSTPTAGGGSGGFSSSSTSPPPPPRPARDSASRAQRRVRGGRRPALENT